MLLPCFPQILRLLEAAVMKGRCELICEQIKLTRDNKNEVLISLKRYLFYYLNLVGY